MTQSILKKLKEAEGMLINGERNREISLAITKVQEAIHWLEAGLKIGEYPTKVD